MSMSVCPVATIAAPVERVWAMLVEPARYGFWADGTVDWIEPPGPAEPGQIVKVSAPALGKRWQVTLAIDRVDVARH